MLTLYAVPHSLYCAKTRIALRAKGLAWREAEPPDGSASPAYRRLVPTGNLPAIVAEGMAGSPGGNGAGNMAGDGSGDLILSDSEAIAEWLEEAFPDPPLLPRGLVPRARMRERGRFHDTRLEPALRALFGQVARPDPTVAGPAAQGVAARLEQLAALLGHDLPFGLGDCGYPPTFLWIELLDRALDLRIRWPGAVEGYRDRLLTLPCVAREMEAYRPHAAAWVEERQR